MATDEIRIAPFAPPVAKATIRLDPNMLLSQLGGVLELELKRINHGLGMAGLEAYGPLITRVAEAEIDVEWAIRQSRARIKQQVAGRP